MRKKIIGILIMWLLCASTILNAKICNLKVTDENKCELENIILDEESTLSLEQSSFQQKTELVNVRLKFYCHSRWNKNIEDFVEGINQIYKMNKGKKNVKFHWLEDCKTLADENFNDKSEAGQRKLLRELRKGKCHEGITVVFAPKNYLESGIDGRCYMNTCQGVRNCNDGGIIMNDTCVLDEMIKTLAHELLHALGLSHDQIKIINPTTGNPESKKKETTLVYKDGKTKILKSSWIGFPCPPDGPHAYGYFDRDGNCFCNESDNEIRPADADTVPGGVYPGFDINGNCNFGDPDDRKHLLYGYTNRRTGVEISEDQMDYIYGNAKQTPGSNHGYLEHKSKLQAKNVSYATPDAVYDSDIGYIDLVGCIGQFYWDCGEETFIRLSLGVREEIPDDKILYYDFYIDQDNDTNTGSPCGNEYFIAFTKTPGFSVAELHEYNDGWNFLEELNWSQSSTVGVWHSDDDCGIVDGNDYRLIIDVPLSSLNIRFKDEMKIEAITTDVESNVVDECGPVYLSKVIEFYPLLDLDRYEGEPSDTVTVLGQLFTPNSDVIIEFNWDYITEEKVDIMGNFTVSFTIPLLTNGYYPIRAIDEYGNYNIHYFYVGTIYDNTPPKIDIKKPEPGIYFKNDKILPMIIPLILGAIDIEVDASDDESGLDKVEFFIDDIYKSEVFAEPYLWTWDEFSFGIHTIRAIAHDNADNPNNDSIVVFKLF